MTGTPHTHEAPDDIVYVNSAWQTTTLARHLVEEHGIAHARALMHQSLRVLHAEAHTQVLSDGDRMLIVGQELRDHAAALLRRLAGQLGSIEHTAFPPGVDQEPVMITTLDHVEEWLSMLITRLRRGEEL